MTRSQIVKSAFRVLTLKLGQAKLMIMINHTYDVIGSMFTQKKWVARMHGLKYTFQVLSILARKRKRWYRSCR